MKLLTPLLSLSLFAYCTANYLRTPIPKHELELLTDDKLLEQQRVKYKEKMEASRFEDLKNIAYPGVK